MLFNTHNAIQHLVYVWERKKKTKNINVIDNIQIGKEKIKKEAKLVRCLKLSGIQILLLLKIKNKYN